ncbi:response regulator transcription factor [Paenibacillus sp. KQZ6P-2]|uniref:Response regulator transcription factor n=1 Tax=Paenibacillus mangrovi TaxID=2931978 RepID=A0A9X1WR19_9BACL|nr:response regulator transcription factor [Paenibacillus mangrovi]MCJ8013106.1 response regulator transcription factor [Paenibacillus mangrovi]
MNKAPIQVIVAEDLDVLREHFCSILRGHEDIQIAGTAASGKMALQLMRTTRADVVLMDIEMDAKHDGIIHAKHILEEFPQTRIVFLTVHEDDETIFSAFETGAVDYVLKTRPDHEIVQRVRSAYEGISQMHPEITNKIKSEFTRIRKNQESLFQATMILSQLTPSELEIIHLLYSDYKISEIAKQRQVEISTIKSQINVILKKFNKKRSKEVISLLRELNIMHLIHKVRSGH